jgi:hypothetical protein
MESKWADDKPSQYKEDTRVKQCDEGGEWTDADYKSESKSEWKFESKSNGRGDDDDDDDDDEEKKEQAPAVAKYHTRGAAGRVTVYCLPVRTFAALTQYLDSKTLVCLTQPALSFHPSLAAASS